MRAEFVARIVGITGEFGVLTVGAAESNPGKGIVFERPPGSEQPKGENISAGIFMTLDEYVSAYDAVTNCELTRDRLIVFVRAAAVTVLGNIDMIDVDLRQLSAAEYRLFRSGVERIFEGTGLLVIED